GIADFWHRWHISLSTWIRDYIYIALGGSRRGLARRGAHGLLAFGICGPWDGGGGKLLVLGVYHGGGLTIASRYLAPLGRAGQELADGLERHPQVAWVLTQLFVAVGWVFFFYPLDRAWVMVQLLFGVS